MAAVVSIAVAIDIFIVGCIAMVVVMLRPGRNYVRQVVESALAGDATAVTLRKRAERAGAIAVVVRRIL